MDLQERLCECFTSWTPLPPRVECRSRRDVTLSYSAGPFSFLQERLLYKVQRREKVPPWVTVYSGGKTRKVIENLAPGHPHKFRVKVFIRSSAVNGLAAAALGRCGDEERVREMLDEVEREGEMTENGDVNEKLPVDLLNDEYNTEINVGSRGWLESQWSGLTWTSTDSEGTSAACFCMAVRCGYLVQVQRMLEARPELVSVINSSSGLTPLATAARKGDVGMVKFLLSCDAEIDQRSSAGRTPLHLAVLAKHTAVAEVLMERGADFTSRDRNDLRVEHYAVDSADLETVKFVLDCGGDVHVRDSNGWTPLFRAVCQGAHAHIVQELLARGSDVGMRDHAGLALSSAARVLSHLGKNRDSILKLVDCQYQHEKALANFSRITKKITTISTMLSLK